MNERDDKTLYTMIPSQGRGKEMYIWVNMMPFLFLVGESTSFLFFLFSELGSVNTE